MLKNSCQLFTISSQGKHGVFLDFITIKKSSYQKEIAERITGMEDNLTPIYPERPSEMNEVELRRGFNSLQDKLVSAVESRDKRQKQLNEALQERDQVVANTGK